MSLFENKPDPDQRKSRLSSLLNDLEEHVLDMKEQGIEGIDCDDTIAALFSGAIQRSRVNLAGAASASPISKGQLTLDTAAGLRAIEKEVEGCRLCGLHAGRNKTVPGRGCFRPEILFVGEAPGRDEDETGTPFVGAAGKLLTKIIHAMGYEREEVFIANIVKCRPPENRKPSPEEMGACLPYLKRQIALLRPRVIVTLGATALEALVGPPVSISKQRGVWHEFEGTPLMPTFHPSYLLRNQSAKKPVWLDMLTVLSSLGRRPAERKGGT